MKLLGIKYPKAGMQYNRGNDTVATIIPHEDDIKKLILHSLFNNENDAVLINFHGKLFVCEKLNTTYTKREIIYHPLSSLVS